MPTTQKPQQKQTKATQKVGGSAKKPVTKVVGGGKGKEAVVKSKATTRGGSFYNYEETKERSITNSTRISDLEKEIKKTNTKISDLEKVINTKISDLETTIKFMYLNDNIWKSKEFKSELKKHLKYIRFLSDDSFKRLYAWYPETNKDLNIPPEVLKDYLIKKVKMEYSYNNENAVPVYIRYFLEINGEKDKYGRPE